jgi:hypothetical protein
MDAAAAKKEPFLLKEGGEREKMPRKEKHATHKPPPPL